VVAATEPSNADNSGADVQTHPIKSSGEARIRADQLRRLSNATVSVQTQRGPSATRPRSETTAQNLTRKHVRSRTPFVGETRMPMTRRCYVIAKTGGSPRT
jgi:hypothetical protein